MHAVADVEWVLESEVEDLGFELVDARWGGSGRRPVLRIRIDREDSSPENGVTVGDCAKVSRALEARLDEHEALSERYVLEVSSPGVERPLKKARDFLRKMMSIFGARSPPPWRLVSPPRLALRELLCLRKDRKCTRLNFSHKPTSSAVF